MYLYKNIFPKKLKLFETVSVDIKWITLYNKHILMYIILYRVKPRS